MNSYELHYVELKVVERVGIAFFEKRTIIFENETLEGVLQEVKEFLQEKKRRIIQRLDNLVNDKNTVVKITKTKKENLLKDYPTNFTLVETITHLVDTEEH